jgi:Raf kinase inhibitor-like YbhB/YbcL family protein
MKNLAFVVINLCLIINLASAQTFTLTSKSVGGQATMKQVANTFGCSGENLSPQLSWTNAPAGTKSFAVTMYDPDAPTGSGWWHWVVFDIPSNVAELVEGAGNPVKGLAPKTCIQSNTDMGQPGYGGPCPPQGSDFHRYVITVFALKTEKLGLDKNASPPMVGFYLSQNVIEKASLIFYYKR